MHSWFSSTVKGLSYLDITSVAGLYFFDLSSSPSSKPDGSRLYKGCGNLVFFIHLLYRERDADTASELVIKHGPRHTQENLLHIGMPSGCVQLWGKHQCTNVIDPKSFKGQTGLIRLSTSSTTIHNMLSGLETPNHCLLHTYIHHVVSLLHLFNNNSVASLSNTNSC